MYDFDERPARAMELLKLVGLEAFANKLPVLVSTGQQQLAAIARAMACDPPLLVADEPTGNLDTKSSDTIIGLFQHFVEQGKTIVMVTHDPSLTSRTDRNIILSDGELINETIAKSLPQLRHRHMLEFTKLVEERIYQPHETILSRDEHVEYFFMIRKGEVEVILQDKKKVENIVSRLGAGEFFGEMELLRGGKSIANVRAGSQPVEALALPRADFVRVMNESPITAEAVAKIVQKRLEEHRTADHRQIDR
jgi:putative ABC transport system ATP-binding protein